MTDVFPVLLPGGDVPSTAVPTLPLCATPGCPSPVLDVIGDQGGALSQVETKGEGKMENDLALKAEAAVCSFLPSLSRSQLSPQLFACESDRGERTLAAQWHAALGSMRTGAQASRGGVALARCHWRCWPVKRRESRRRFAALRAGQDRVATDCWQMVQAAYHTRDDRRGHGGVETREGDGAKQGFKRAKEHTLCAPRAKTRDA